MKFRKLTIENCKFFQFATEIRFPVGDDGRSIFLIGGMNGAGKTSIMEAINYCLYGAKWAVLNETVGKSVYGQGKQYPVEKPRLIAWMVEAALRARTNESTRIKDLLDSPSLFPFRLAHISAEHVASLSPRLNIVRHGLDDDLVMLRRDDRLNKHPNKNT